jgi:hypothetical protein
MTGQREREKNGFYPECKDDDGLNDPDGATAKLDGFGNLAQIVLHGGHVRRLAGGVRAGRRPLRARLVLGAWKLAESPPPTRS